MATYAEQKPREKSAAEEKEAHLAWSLSQPAVGGCLFCPEFHPEGTYAEIIAACAEHRAELHPELKRKPRKRRGTVSGVMSFGQATTDEQYAEIQETREKRMRLLGIAAE